MMKKKIKLSILFSVVVALTCLSSISFSRDNFDGVGFHHWQKRLLESRDSKNVVLLEMLGETAEESDGLTFRILQIHGPYLFYGDNPDNKRDFQRLLLNIFKTNDLYKLRSFYGIKDGESDLHVARVFQTVFYLYAAVDMGFTYRLRENLKEILSWGWSDSDSPELLCQIIKSMGEFLGPKISYHIRTRVKNIRSIGEIGGTAKFGVITEWELVEVESAYNPKEDKIELKDKTVEKSIPVVELLDKAEADKIEGDYGTTKGLLLERDIAIALFQSLSKTSKIFENPSPSKIGSSNWERLQSSESDSKDADDLSQDPNLPAEKPLVVSGTRTLKEVNREAQIDGIPIFTLLVNIHFIYTKLVLGRPEEERNLLFSRDDDSLFTSKAFILLGHSDKDEHPSVSFKTSFDRFLRAIEFLKAKLDSTRDSQAIEKLCYIKKAAFDVWYYLDCTHRGNVPGAKPESRSFEYRKYTPPTIVQGDGFSRPYYFYPRLRMREFGTPYYYRRR